MNALNLIVQFVIALPKVWSLIQTIMQEIEKAKAKRVEERQQDAVEKLEKSKPGTQERKDALKDWIDSDRG